MEIYVHDHLSRNSKFCCSSDSFKNSNAVIVGLPFDNTASFRPGARFGPVRIREASFMGGIEEYSIYQNKSLEDFNFYDAGDVDMRYGNTAANLETIYQVAKDLLVQDKRIFSMGGEHLVSLPMVKAYHEKYPDLVVVQFDAHADLRDEYKGEKLSHATVIRRIWELLQPQSIFQLGIRSGDRDELALTTPGQLYANQVLPAIPAIKSLIGQRPVYITLDIDVLDPAFAPGTGTPESGGISAAELISAMLELASLNVVGFDLVEIAPLLDASGQTATLGAKLLREALLAYT